MSDGLLVGRELDHLREADLTYAEVGSTKGKLPSGYQHLCRQVTIGSGTARFQEAAQTVLSWSMHRRSGVHVRPSTKSVVDGGVAVLQLGVEKVAVSAPVKIVYVVNETHRRGFAYGTLPGHPESGEEAFLVELHDDETVTFTITAFSRPASLLARAAGPAGRAVQAWITSRYLRSLHV